MCGSIFIIFRILLFLFLLLGKCGGSVEFSLVDLVLLGFSISLVGDFWD
jgi:hypothetical protein